MPRPALSRTLPVRPAFPAILSRLRPRTGPAHCSAGRRQRGAFQDSQVGCNAGAARRLAPAVPTR